MVRAAFLVLAVAFGLATLACLLAARRTWQRNVTEDARPARNALVAWWAGGAALTALQLGESLCLAFERADPTLAVVITALRAVALSVALPGAGSYAYYIATGGRVPPSAGFIAALAVALAQALVLAPLDPRVLAADRILVTLLSGGAGPGGLALGALIVGVPLASMSVVGYAAWRASRARQRTRGALVAGGIAIAALFTTLGIWLAPGGIVVEIAAVVAASGCVGAASTKFA